MRLTNERRVTAIEQFNEQFFAQNVLLGTVKILIVRNGNLLLRVNLETGEVKPTRGDLNHLDKRRSPDGRLVVGVTNGQFYAYDVETDKAGNVVPVGQTALSDCQWLDNDRCALLLGGKQVGFYDRRADRLEGICSLPPRSNVFRMGEPSPDGQFVFCTGNGAGVLVDVEKKTAVQVAGGSGITWVSRDTFAFSREVPDTDLRGTWLQTAGQSERRISPEPFVVTSVGAKVLTLPSANLVVYATNHGLMKMRFIGADAVKLVNLPRPPLRMIGIEDNRIIE